MVDLCYVCKRPYPEWLTPCEEWVCGEKCYGIHVPACTWCIYVIEKKVKEAPSGS